MLVDSIHSAMACKLTREDDCTFTVSDKSSDNSYIPLPNVRPETFFQYANDLEKKSLMAQKTAHEQNKTKTRVESAASSPVLLENDRLTSQLKRQKCQMEQERVEIEQTRKDLEKRAKELNKLQAELVGRQQNIRDENVEQTERLKLLMAGDEIYGLTRPALLSKTWHKNHPTAANHLFGFASWKELVYMMHALFDVLPPGQFVANDEMISSFEQYLMGYTRIHTGMTVSSIALVWNRDRGHAGRLINKAVKSIGSAGKD